MITKEWIKAAVIRALKTVAQTAVALISTQSFAHEVQWGMVASGSILSGILSLLTSLGGLPELENCATDTNEIDGLK